MSLSKDVAKFFDRSLIKRDQLCDQSKQGNNEDEPKKIKGKKSSIKNLSKMLNVKK